MKKYKIVFPREICPIIDERLLKYNNSIFFDSGVWNENDEMFFDGPDKLSKYIPRKFLEEVTTKVSEKYDEIYPDNFINIAVVETGKRLGSMIEWLRPDQVELREAVKNVVIKWSMSSGSLKKDDDYTRLIEAYKKLTPPKN